MMFTELMPQASVVASPRGSAKAVRVPASPPKAVPNGVRVRCIVRGNGVAELHGEAVQMLGGRRMPLEVAFGEVAKVNRLRRANGLPSLWLECFRPAWDDKTESVIPGRLGSRMAPKMVAARRKASLRLV